MSPASTQPAPRQAPAEKTDAASVERGPMLDTQRARILEAAGQVACERALANVTVGHIVQRAGVSRRTFYEIFADCDDCLRAVLEDALERARARVEPAWVSEASWRERLRHSLVELLCLFDEEQVAGQLLIVESLGAGREVLERRAHVLQTLVSALEQGRADARAGSGATSLSAEGALGGVLGVLHSRISQRAPERLIGLTGELMSMLVLPYHGLAAARRELERPAPETQAPQPEAPLRSDPFKDAGMRLTYRTMRVLSTIEERPGCSNRQVGELAEMRDQGQISKLLARLERLGMIANVRERQAKGEPNAWTLTTAGEQMMNRFRVHTNSHDATGVDDKPFAHQSQAALSPRGEVS